MSETTQAIYIEIRKTQRGQDKPFIVGTRISVEDIFIHHEIMGKSPDRILEAFPHLSLSQVHGALAYAYDHIDLIRQQMKGGESFIDSVRANLGAGPLQVKLDDMEANGDSVSS